ncbi:MFS transporter [Pseudarthrobacter cellobiosi]|uniref:MFS transporter n=1 Tax=Pseudarthrobacter cellobiosi TaxID=2953654 RepID=UPI00208FD0A6|nr:MULTISPECIES: aromatic acid/H+ symport family MFS transporter [unclassified Pseudarthrobacter]MCO4255810.1 aromatic acid/H+ symport family MFS transporter [Pseudarthrobacter sp. HLT1-5]MCO4275839.1 aromatic acid/H+ symport family MFS transporter [Pseudarthrobacter sp. HLT3-5]
MNHTPTAAAPGITGGAGLFSSGASRFSKQSAMAVLVCWLLVVFDGYDLIVYGTVQSSLINDTGWGLTKATAGTVGSMAFVGMMIGAIFAGRMSDTWGRRRTIIGCAILFSVFTILCAFSPNAVVFGALRLLAGIGLGGLVPSANALVAELVPTKWRPTVATLMMSGVPIGGSIAALVGIPLIPAFGWPAMFLVAVLAVIVVIPLGLRYLPETLAPSASSDAAVTREPAGFGSLLRAPFLGMSLLYAFATLVTLFAWYGLGTWLPNLMQLAGYNLGSALTFALALNVGAVAGSVITAWAGTRFGPIPTAIAAAGVAAAALLVLVTGPPVAVVYLMLVLAGVGTHGTQCLIIAAVASHYPAHLRGTALGWALGVGRIGAVAAPQVGGLLLAAGLGVNSNFLAFAGAAAVAAVLLAAISAKINSTTKISEGDSNV